MEKMSYENKTGTVLHCKQIPVSSSIIAQFILPELRMETASRAAAATSFLSGPMPTMKDGVTLH